MSEPLSLHELADRAKALERGMADGKIAKDADALRKRIDAGYEKVSATGLPADDSRVVKAQAQIAELEDQLARTERLLIAHYFEQSLLLIVRDALKWSSVPEGSRMRVLMPGLLDMTVKLDNIEIPFQVDVGDRVTIMSGPDVLSDGELVGWQGALARVWIPRKNITRAYSPSQLAVLTSRFNRRERDSERTRQQRIAGR